MRRFLYGDNYFTAKELLKKPEILRYLKRNGSKKGRKDLYDEVELLLDDKIMGLAC